MPFAEAVFFALILGVKVEGTKACLLRRFIRRFRCTPQERAQEGEDEKEEAQEGEAQEGEAQEAEARRS